MKANEAIILSLKGQKDIFERALKKIENDAQGGSRTATIYTMLKNKVLDESPCQSVVDKLVGLGYTVKMDWSTANEEYKLTINW